MAGSPLSYLFLMSSIEEYVSPVGSGQKVRYSEGRNSSHDLSIVKDLTPTCFYPAVENQESRTVGVVLNTDSEEGWQGRSGIG